MSVTIEDQDLGAMTAYGYAKQGGYTGTPQQFATLMASYGTVAQEVADTAAQIDTAVSKGLSDIETKKQEALADIPSDYTTLSEEVTQIRSDLNTLYQPFAESVSTLTNSYLAEHSVTADIATYSSKILYIRGANAAYNDHKDTIDPGKYWIVQRVKINNESETDIHSHYVRAFNILKSNGTVLTGNVYTYSFSGSPELPNYCRFTDSIPSGETKTLLYVSYVDLSSYSASDLTNISWQFGLGNFASSVSESTITADITGNLEGVWLFDDNGTYSNENIQEYIGKNIISDEFVIEEAKHSETSTYTDNIRGTWEGKTIVTYGDSITANGGWQDYIKRHFNCTVINAGIGGTSVSDRETTSPFCSPDRIALIPSTADAVIIMGGSNDWAQDAPIGDLSYDSGWNEDCFMGALASTLKQIQDRCTNAIIFVASPLGGRLETAGTNQPMPTENTDGKTLGDFAEASHTVSKTFGLPYIPVNEESGVNVWNGATYLADAVHPNDLGKAKIAVVMIGALEHTRPV